MAPMNCTACSAPATNTPLETFREPLFGRDFEILACASCGVVFSPIPPEFPLREWYTKAAHLYSEAEWIIHPSPKNDWRFNFFFKQMHALGLKGHLLDIGSGDGRFLVRAGEEGWQGALSGLEGNPDMARRRKGNYTVEIGEIQDLVERPGLEPYDVVTIFDVLEHLSEPGRSFSNIVKLIKPGGIFVATVPNMDRIRFLEREAWDFPPNHVTRWTAGALARIAKRNGLEVLDVRVSDFTFQSFSDQLFYKLFPVAVSGAKRLLYGSRADGGKTLTDLLAEDAGGVKAGIADKSTRRRIEVVLRDVFKVLMFIPLLPVALYVRLVLPSRKGDCLCLVARKPAIRP